MVGREGLDRSTLLETFTEAGAADPVSHLSTGNVSFNLEPDDLPAFVDAVDARLTEVVGRDIEVFIRTIDHLTALDGAGAFARSPFAEVRDCVVTFFHQPPELPWKLPHLIRNDLVAVVAAAGREVFSVTRELDGRYAAPGGVLERVTGQRATSRGWSTLEKILGAN